ncbi:LysE family translocator [Pararhodobacter oceanensis]|uniref:Lysine transporter LysE n=1 Tax=Pararhodobacter oceanensis TaxID=2172121 RepID=A0A2T8HSX5_9RHOB|nr:LysE family translocator [Pararhodobacter oceanensis]PVH28493.1 lysine transporter LysE [Pararhodobacter oceanensis]
MTLSAQELLIYAGAMALLWAVPGPVWVALIARSLSGGMRGAWPLAVGVALGDLIWPLCAVFGLAWILSVYGGFLEALRWVAAGVFIIMGVMIWRKPAETLTADRRMTRPGVLPGFLVGLAAVTGNPKAILFYMGVLPGFFDLTRITALDIAAIIAVSAIVPMLGNLGLALFLDRARRLLQSPQAMQRLNMVSGVLLVLVGLVIPFT